MPAAARKDAQRLGRQLHRLTGRWAWLVPATRIGRIGAGSLLIVCGAFGFLPVLGYWMIPLGVLVLAQDIPMLRRPVGRIMLVAERRWRRWRRRRNA
jgi:hypothetical protein